MKCYKFASKLILSLGIFIGVETSSYADSWDGIETVAQKRFKNILLRLNSVPCGEFNIQNPKVKLSLIQLHSLIYPVYAYEWGHRKPWHEDYDDAVWEVNSLGDQVRDLKKIYVMMYIEANFAALSPPIFLPVMAAQGLGIKYGTTTYEKCESQNSKAAESIFFSGTKRLALQVIQEVGQEKCNIKKGISSNNSSKFKDALMKEFSQSYKDYWRAKK